MFLLFAKKLLKLLRRTAIGTKFAPPYSTQFMAELGNLKEILRKGELKPYV